jgi:hypothetical protein
MNTTYPIIRFGSFDVYEPLFNSPTPPNSPRKRSGGVKYNNIQEQLEFATVKYNEVLDKYMSTPCNKITKKQSDDVWAWGIFSETVLPMLKFIDE